MNTERVHAVQARHWFHILPVKPGMRLEIHEKIGEWSNQRTWKFKCLVLKVQKPNNPDGTFLVRGQTARKTIEKIYPLSFPNFEKVILLDEHKVKKSKLYFMRDKIGRDAKLKSIIDPERRNIDLQVLATEGKVVHVEPEVEEVLDESIVEDVSEVETEATDETTTNDAPDAVEKTDAPETEETKAE